MAARMKIHSVNVELHASRGHGARQDDPWRYSIGASVSVMSVEGPSIFGAGFAIGLFPRNSAAWWRQIEVIRWAG